MFQSHCKIAYYDKNDRIEIDNIFKVDELYKLLNPYRVHLYHKDITGTSAPIEVELLITSGKSLELRVASGLGLWLPYYKPDYDMDKQSLKDFPINEFGYIDNRELYLLNTPRLIGFIKDLRRFFETHNGKERSNNAQLEKFPEFPWYK
ncbi:MAG TPA: hypothetical protein VK169_12105 [Saprospiraceae bacterium]|nr:hypothetical protein [Saprospiraceae bacterium]